MLKNLKGSLLSVFRHCETLKKIPPKGPSSISLIFCNRVYVSFFKNVLRFLSLRYSADLTLDFLVLLFFENVSIKIVSSCPEDVSYIWRQFDDICS